jgi:asparagine synthase (glutamine-hydrolysing)
MTCGIAGFVGLSDRELLGKMLQVQRHRGPDSTGYFIDSNVGLGNDRLSIIDLKKGDQPIHNEDESVWITFNGEVYNYVELRRRLESGGHKFYTETDTECVVHAYEDKGADCLKDLRGMFAFAIWDKKRKSIFAARDRLGKKPLYYALVNDVFIFSSELKGILQYRDVKKKIKKKALDLFLTYFYVPSPDTIFEGISKLPPGHYLLFGEDGLEVNQYWDMHFTPVNVPEQEVMERVFSLISDSVRIRMRSDVPVGGFLSGGIDSSVVAAMMTKFSDNVRTVTVGFEENDEHLRYGKIVSQYLNTNHREYVVDAGSVEILPKLLWHHDEPFADSSIIPTYRVSEVMRREVKVALTGDGGDEMFMGYPILKDQAMYGVYNALPKTVRRAALRTILKVPRDMGIKKMASHALEKDYDAQDFSGRWMMRTVAFTPDLMRRLYTAEQSENVYPTLDFVRSFTDKYRNGDPMDAVTYATMKGYLPDMILTKVDRMSMAVSLEARCPLLEQELAEYVGTVPSQLKFRGSTTKYVFKKMALEKELLPKDVVVRKKAGFGSPVDKWIGREWKDLSDQALEKAGKLGLFDQRYLRELTKDRFVHSNRIFGLTVLTLWHSMYIENDSNSPATLDKLLYA